MTPTWIAAGCRQVAGKLPPSCPRAGPNLPHSIVDFPAHTFSLSICTPQFLSTGRWFWHLWLRIACILQVKNRSLENDVLFPQNASFRTRDKIRFDGFPARQLGAQGSISQVSIWPHIYGDSDSICPSNYFRAPNRTMLLKVAAQKVASRLDRMQFSEKDLDHGPPRLSSTPPQPLNLYHFISIDRHMVLAHMASNCICLTSQ